MRSLTSLTATASASLLLAGLAGAASATPRVFPETIALPDGWRAEGVATGTGTEVYAGSLATGAVWKADLRTGEGAVLVPPQPGRISVGLAVSQGLLFVAGGPNGTARVHDTTNGDEVASFQLTDSGFVNDVIVTREAAWFTNSMMAELYRVDLANGRPTGQVATVPLTGDWQQVDGFNANGIEATPDGSSLIVVNSTLGTLHAVDPSSGVTTLIDTDTDLTLGDGILLRGKELAVVRNRVNEIVLLRLARDLSSATATATLTDPDFEVPTTVAAFGGTLYAVNARFGLDPDGPFDIVKVDGTGPRA